MACRLLARRYAHRDLNIVTKTNCTKRHWISPISLSCNLKICNVILPVILEPKIQLRSTMSQSNDLMQHADNMLLNFCVASFGELRITILDTEQKLFDPMWCGPIYSSQPLQEAWTPFHQTTQY